MYYYAEGTASTPGTTTYSSAVTVVSDPVFTEIFLYDVHGTWITGDAFTIGTSAQTVGTVTGGKYGHVSKWSGSDLYVTLGTGSAAFAGTDTFVDTPTVEGAARATATVNSVSAATDLETELRATAEDMAVSAAKLIHPVRLAVSGQSEGMGLFELLELLGKMTCIRRLRKALTIFPLTND